MRIVTRVIRAIHHALTSCPGCGRALGQDGACPFCDRYQSFDASALPCAAEHIELHGKRRADNAWHASARALTGGNQ